MKQFKIRASQIGKIMTNPRIKSEVLSQTTKSYCEQWVKEQIYNRRYEFSSKYTEKGNTVEDNAIDLISEHLYNGMLMIKNDDYFENDFCTGTPDIIIKDEIIDNKSSWDCFTFPLFDTELNKDYYWQMQGYMWLTGYNRAKVIYTLMDTPYNIIESEAKRYCYKNGFDELDLDIYNEFKDKMTYYDVPVEKRIKSFEVIRNDEQIEEIKQRVILCRDYIDDLLQKL